MDRGSRVSGSMFAGAILAYAAAGWSPIEAASFIRGDVDANSAHELTDAVLAGGAVKAPADTSAVVTSAPTSTVDPSGIVPLENVN